MGNTCEGYCAYDENNQLNLGKDTSNKDYKVRKNKFY